MELKSVSEARGFYMELILLGAGQELHKYLLNEKKIDCKKKRRPRTKSLGISSSKEWTKRKLKRSS